ncbi:polysaccharide deacetylase family protein [Oceanibacterium hippocampi]|uniref:Polysaccharide deacetylase n=1 Tax=Oceanibacterium hippocampi TaxID=745714 RepID=A0A1Y5RQ58_9PROT|nr:polysaccharide deacetylase family protein [Oceanibacterium hippocampi]SLN20029.1 hypothetical protein OCH7691_00470 [Oceanibacterium hippocampi]
MAFATVVLELDRWHAAGRTADFWWRDDDAVAAGPALDRLSALARRAGVPLALAVIPANLDDSLGAGEGQYVLQHGYAHANHAGPDEKKCELAANRPADAVLDELCRGRAILERRFGARFLNVLVPPWNRIAAPLAARLGEAGYTGLSTWKARPAAVPLSGLVQVNCHADPVNWRGGRGYLGDQAFALQIADHLAARREGRADPGEPTGILSHHLAMDEATWGGLERLLELLAGHPAARARDAASLFGPDPSDAT